LKKDTCSICGDEGIVEYIDIYFLFGFFKIKRTKCLCEKHYFQKEFNK